MWGYPVLDLLILAGVSLIAWLLTGQVRQRALRHQWLDHPVERSSHDQPVPTGGGIAVIAALALGALLLGWRFSLSPVFVWTVAPPVLALTILGWLDDRVSLSAWLRFSVHVLAAVWVLFASGLAALEGPAAGGPDPVTLLLIIATVALLVWMTNLFNFMDGSNGLAAGQAAFAALGMAVVSLAAVWQSGAVLPAVLGAACLGFLPWNSPVPRIFMGDVGSIPIGFLLGWLLVYGTFTGAWPVTAWLLMGTFIVDATLTLGWRVVRGEQWYTAHKKHLYQRLIGNGWPHRRVLRIYMVINLCVTAPVIGIGLLLPNLAWPLLAAGLLLLAGIWLATFHRLRRAHDR